MQDFSGVFKDVLARITGVERRVNNMEVSEYIRFYPILGASAYLINTTIINGDTYTSVDLRGVGGIAATAKGFFGTMWITPLIATTALQICPSDDTPSAYSQQYLWATTAITNAFNYSQFLLVPLGSDGMIKIKAVGANTEVFIVAAGYWG